MSLFREFHESQIPSVPDDKQEREEAVRRSYRKLAQAKASVPEALRVAESLDEHTRRNHYVDRIREGYGVREI